MEQIIEAKKILVRVPNWVGDVVMATPAFRCIRENFADSHITLLIKKEFKRHNKWFFHGLMMLLNWRLKLERVKMDFF